MKNEERRNLSTEGQNSFRVIRRSKEKTTTTRRWKITIATTERKINENLCSNGSIESNVYKRCERFNALRSKQSTIRTFDVNRHQMLSFVVTVSFARLHWKCCECATLTRKHSKFTSKFNCSRRAYLRLASARLTLIDTHCVCFANIFAHFCRRHSLNFRIISLLTWNECKIFQFNLADEKSNEQHMKMLHNSTKYFEFRLARNTSSYIIVDKANWISLLCSRDNTWLPQLTLFCEQQQPWAFSEKLIKIVRWNSL